MKAFYKEAYCELCVSFGKSLCSFTLEWEIPWKNPDLWGIKKKVQYKTILPISASTFNIHKGNRYLPIIS